jgi:hypothetical protein
MNDFRQFEDVAEVVDYFCQVYDRLSDAGEAVTDRNFRGVVSTLCKGFRKLIGRKQRELWFANKYIRRGTDFLPLPEDSVSAPSVEDMPTPVSAPQTAVVEYAAPELAAVVEHTEDDPNERA